MKNRISFTVFVVLIILISVSCKKNSSDIVGAGPIVTRDFDMPVITNVRLGIDGNVFLTCDDTTLVTIEAQKNIIDNIEKNVKAGLWDINFRNNVLSHDGINIYITSPMIAEALITRSGNIHSTVPYNDSLASATVGISGTGNVSMQYNIYDMTSTISGSGNILLSGSAYEHKITISGTGNVNAYSFATSSTEVNLSGMGNAYVFATGYLKVTISGSGNVYYKGYPDIDLTITGSGNLIDGN